MIFIKFEMCFFCSVLHILINIEIHFISNNILCILHFSDYIVVPKNQEDDIHNVQSVIDSLALDYLQISLSHITGADSDCCHVYVSFGEQLRCSDTLQSQLES